MHPARAVVRYPPISPIVQGYVFIYRQISNISNTKLQNLNVSLLVLKLLFAQSFEAKC